MSKFSEKKNEVDAELFDSSKNISLWPVGIQVNSGSSTGYSYGTLAEKQAPMGPGYVMIDGFPIKNLDYIVTESSGAKYSMSPSEFNNRFIPKNGG